MSAEDIMNLSINGQSQVPPGFRFYPTEEELLHYYLRKKLACQKIDLDVIREVDLNKLEPWEIQEKCKIGRTPQNDWYFFSHKDKKYPTGTRTNRATAVGFWKATGRDKIIYNGCARIGLRKTLVFYIGRAPHGQKSDWIMGSSNFIGEYLNGNKDGWVVCRVFRKKNYLKTTESPKINSCASMDSKKQILRSSNHEVLDHIPLHVGNNYQNNSNDILFHEKFLHLPDDQPVDDIFQEIVPSASINYGDNKFNKCRFSPVQDWVTLDRLVASQLNGQVVVTGHHKETSLFTSQSSTFQEDHKEYPLHLYADTTVCSSEDDLWTLVKLYSSSSSLADPSCRFFL